MILEFKIKNFLSFKDEVTFSFKATGDKCMEDSHVVKVGNTRILKLGVVYGQNASGKSNLINAFDFLHDFLLNTTSDKDEEIGVVPFRFDKKTINEPSEFRLTFYVENIKHIYTLKVTNSSVLFEKLEYYPGIQPADIFIRKNTNSLSEITFGKKITVNQAQHDEISVKCLPNMSFFAAYNKVNIDIPGIETVINWIKFNYLQAIRPTNSLTGYVEGKMLKDKAYKDYIIKYLTRADFNIRNIKTELIKEEIPEKLIDFFITADISTEQKDKIKRDKFIEVTKSVFTHEVISNKGKKALYELERQLQSRGTLRIMGISGAINTALIQKSFLPIDEIESSLHPKLIEYVIENFLKESKESQILIATHYDGLLSAEDLIRNDNVHFTNKLPDGSTEIYSLADFKGVNRISSLQKAYRYGNFGATPNI